MSFINPLKYKLICSLHLSSWFPVIDNHEPINKIKKKHIHIKIYYLIIMALFIITEFIGSNELWIICSLFGHADRNFWVLILISICSLLAMRIMSLHPFILVTTGILVACANLIIILSIAGAIVFSHNVLVVANILLLLAFLLTLPISFRSIDGPKRFMITYFFHPKFPLYLVLRILKICCFSILVFITIWLRLICILFWLQPFLFFFLTCAFFPDFPWFSLILPDFTWFYHTLIHIDGYSTWDFQDSYRLPLNLVLSPLLKYLCCLRFYWILGWWKIGLLFVQINEFLFTRA